MDDFHEQTKLVDEPRKRHGLPWQAPELAKLKELYMQGTLLREICDLMERPKEGVLSKLVQLGLIRRVADGYRYVYRRKVLPDAYKVNYPNRETPNHTLQTQPKEPIMKIETKVFINDQDASTMTDDQIFGEIRRAENRVHEMKAIKTPTKKLADNIIKLEKYAADLAKYVDSR